MTLLLSGNHTSGGQKSSVEEGCGSPEGRGNPTRESKRIRITWPQNKKLCSQLHARCEKAFLCIVILHVGT